MKTKNVISAQNLPTKFPFMFTAVIFLLIDRFNIPQIWLGVIITGVVIVWLSAIYQIFFGEKKIDIKRVIDNEI